MSEIRAATVLPAKREPFTLHTSDGLRLVGSWRCRRNGIRSAR